MFPPRRRLSPRLATAAATRSGCSRMRPAFLAPTPWVASRAAADPRLRPALHTRLTSPVMPPLAANPPCPAPLPKVAPAVEPRPPKISRPPNGPRGTALPDPSGESPLPPGRPASGGYPVVSRDQFRAYTASTAQPRRIGLCLLLVVLLVGAHPFVAALVDSGAERTIATKQLLDELGVTWTRSLGHPPITG